MALVQFESEEEEAEDGLQDGTWGSCEYWNCTEDALPGMQFCAEHQAEADRLIAAAETS